MAHAGAVRLKTKEARLTLKPKEGRAVDFTVKLTFKFTAEFTVEPFASLVKRTGCFP